MLSGFKKLKYFKIKQPRLRNRIHSQRINYTYPLQSLINSVNIFIRLDNIFVQSNVNCTCDSHALAWLL